MTILEALAGHYDRLKGQPKTVVPHYGYTQEQISFCIVLSSQGECVDVEDRRDLSDRRPRPSLLTVPQSFKRPGITPRPFFLWDKTAFVLGITRHPDTKQTIPSNRQEHLSFKAFHQDMLAQPDDEGLQALLTFLNEWQPDSYKLLSHAEDMTDTNVVFRLDGERSFLHDRPAAQAIWVNHLAGRDSKKGLCLVSGKRAAVARLHPAVKGVRGAQSSGASIVSFNLNAFESFGKNQGENAPVSEQTVFAYTTALNTLLARDSRRRIQIGDATTVFWAEAAGDEAGATAAEDLFSMLVDPPPTDAEEAVRVGDKLSAIAEGRPLFDVEPKVNKATRFYVLGLAPNAARLSIRFWHEESIGVIAQRIVEHWRDLRLDPTPWTTPPAAWRLLYQTAAQHKADNIPPTLGGALMRAILTGGRYPRSLLVAVVVRMRADKEITGIRAAICKGCLARDHRLGFEKEDVPVSLNSNETNPAYRLGRLFSVYESVQRAALGHVNTTIKDRYFGAASATPAAVFPLLERNSANHLASLRKGQKGGLAHWFDQEIDSILDGFDATFPRSLRLEDQGRFAIGYHHQRATKRAASDEEGEGADAENHDEG